MLERVLRWFDSKTHPTIGTGNRQPSRKDKDRLATISYFKEIPKFWNPLSSYVKADWKRAGGYCSRSNYQLFISDWAYRYRTGLAYPSTPNNFHQMWGLSIKNPEGLDAVTAIWKTIAATGLITVRFSISKTETEAPAVYSFRVRAEAYYFDAGENKLEEYIYEAPTGNLSWGWQQFQCGTAGRYYFEIILFLELHYYDAEVLIDNLKISDSSGELYYEYFNPKRPNDWEPIPLVRKEGWAFEPAYLPEYFEQKFIE